MMLELYWGCFAGGILFTLVTVVLGDFVSQAFGGALDFLSADWLNPTVLAGGITAFGGAGVVLTDCTGLIWPVVAVLALMSAAGAGALLYHLAVKPMKRSENSTAYSMQSLHGRLGEVITPIPSDGYGEVLLKVGAGNANHIAASFERIDIQAGARVVVVEVKDDAVYVSRFENNE